MIKSILLKIIVFLYLIVNFMLIFENWVSSLPYLQASIIRFPVSSLKVSNLITLDHLFHSVLDNNEIVGFLSKHWIEQVLNMGLVK